MNQQNPSTDFEQRLLGRLRTVVAERAAAAPPQEAATPIPAWQRRGSRLALGAAAGAATAAAVVAGILIVSSGPNAESAAAEVLHETAAAAASQDGPATSPLPGPDQFYYKKFKRLELQSWIPGGELMGGGVMTRPGAFVALMPSTQEWWTAPDGAGRVREVAGTPRFLTSEEQRRWEADGSRLPAPFDPEYQQKYPLAYGDALEAGRGVVDTEHPAMEGFHFPDTSSYPTEPEALRQVVEDHRILGAEIDDPDQPSANPHGTKAAITGLFDILVEGSPMTPQLRAAVFNALAELPGIEVDTEATDFLGRQGYAIRSVDQKTGGALEFIFDPDTAELLAQREVLGDRQQGPFMKGIPAGLTIRETAYLQSAIVDSTDETGAGAEVVTADRLR